MPVRLTADPFSDMGAKIPENILTFRVDSL